MNLRKFLLKTVVVLLLVNCILEIIPTINAEDSTIEIIQLHPHDNIQQVINSAQPYTIIQLNPGVYTSSFTINKPVTIRGVNKHSTVINVSTRPNNAGIILSAEHIILSNVTISNTASGLYTTAIRINSAHCTISNCTITNTPIGIVIWSNYTEIKQTHFINCSDEGILLISTTITSCHDNKIHNCSFYYNCDAIELQYSSHNEIRDCIMKKNSHSAIDAICEKNNNNTIAECIIKDNTVHGIYFSSSQYNLIKNCIFSNNTDGNIVFTHNSYKNRIIHQNNSKTSIHQKMNSSPILETNTSTSISQELNSNTNFIFYKLKIVIELIRETIHHYCTQFQ